jgi:hypothetical protein
LFITDFIISRYFYESHSYIRFDDAFSTYGIGIVHDPDCKCMVEK